MKILARNRKGHNTWEEVRSHGYLGETDLQKLLADSPSLISVNDIRTDASPLIVAVREIGLPGSGNTDIVAFSEAGDMAIVECKLAANAEIKRKVIGQALEYGAYLWKMPYEMLDEKVKARSGKTLADLVRENVGREDWDEEAFRETIGETLEKGNFILIIAVDEINEELARTIHFLNGCGQPAFAFAAIELRRFQTNDTEILVPNIISVSSPGSGPGGPPRKKWTETRFLDVMREEQPANIAGIIEELYEWSRSTADEVSWGTGDINGSFTYYYKKNGKNVSVFSLYTSATLTMNFGAFGTVMPKEIMNEFRRKINDIPGFEEIRNNPIYYPSTKIDRTFLGKPESLAQFKQVVEELRDIVQEDHA